MSSFLSFFLIFIFLFSCSQPSTNSITAGSFEVEEEDFSAYSGLIAQSAEDYLKIEQTKMIRSFSGAKDDQYSVLPSSMDLSKILPEAGNQGKQNSCTGWVLGFAVKSFQENRELGWGLNSNHLFSPSFIYNQINGGKDEGADLVDAMKFLMEAGTIPLSLMPYKTNDYKTQPTISQKELAKGFRSLGYRRMDEGNLNHLKSYLASGEPVLLVIEMYKNFLRRGMARSKGLYKEKQGEKLGFHSVVAVGYDDSKKAVKI